MPEWRVKWHSKTKEEKNISLEIGILKNLLQKSSEERAKESHGVSNILEQSSSVKQKPSVFGL